jgi:hypothetical protein
MADDLLFGAIAVAEGFLSREQLDRALADHGATPLGDWLAARGHLTPAQVETILDIQRINVAARVESPDGGLFGQIAVREGIVPAAAVNEALKRQASGELIGQRLLKDGAITARQIALVLSKQERVALRCPGCGVHYLAEGLAPGAMIVCLRCLRAMAVPLVPSGALVGVAAERITRDSFGPFRIERELGRGPFSVTFLARRERPVVLRILTRRPADLDALRRHVEVIEIEGAIALVRDFVEGEPMALASLKRSVAGRVAILEQAARALAGVHGNLKPANVIVSETVACVDAGLSPLHGASPAPCRAPEQLLGREIDAKTDAYALGAMLYEVLAGKPPFRRGTPDELRDAILRLDAAPPSDWNPEAPRDLEGVCLRALDKDPSERPAPDEFAADLGRWREGKAVRTTRSRNWLRRLFE